eukprot:4791039-Prymnesium_polylepis.1
MRIRSRPPAAPRPPPRPLSRPCPSPHRPVHAACSVITPSVHAAASATRVRRGQPPRAARRSPLDAPAVPRRRVARGLAGPSLPPGV